MPARKQDPKKRLYTVEQANATLPLLRPILRDITELASSLTERHHRLASIAQGGSHGSVPAYDEELQSLEGELERAKERMREYETELRELGVELKDYHTGLVDFRAEMEGREVYLCWKLGEPEVAHWHDLDAGFTGRQPLLVGPKRRR